MDEQVTIAQILQRHLPRLRVNDEVLEEYEKSNPFEAKYSLVDRATYLGIEVEVENLHGRWGKSHYWTVTDDGSLRNSGAEFVSCLS